MSVVKFVGDAENWQWQTQTVTVDAPTNDFQVTFPANTPLDRLVAVRVGAWLEEDDTETPLGIPIFAQLYRRNNKSSNLWPNNSTPWAVVMRAFETETIAWLKLQGWSSNDQIQFGLVTAGEQLATRVSVSILVKTVGC